jgi:hypothetical protein
MPLTKTREETVRVAGNCAEWFKKCLRALEHGSFSRLRIEDDSFVVDADYTGFTIDGSIRLLLTQEGGDVAIEIHIIAAVDNIWALRDPLRRIIRAFMHHLK